MQLVIRNSPAPIALKAVFLTAVIFLSIFHFSPSALNAQALDQLSVSAPAIEIPLAPPPQNATVYSAAPGLNVYFLSVGQGDSEYIELPNGQNVLIDGGPDSSASGALAQFLAQKKVTRISHVVLTHPHADHYKGLQYIFSALKVDNFYDTRMDNTGTSADEAIRAQAKNLGANLVYPAPGDSLAWGPGGVSAKVFNSCPQAVASGDGHAINDCSITIRLAYQNTSMLFVGDAQSDVEAQMISAFGDGLRSDVLKVGHHGSAYSSTDPFLAAVQPKRAYIEVGTNNYGHPTQSALGRLQKAGAKIYRTDLDGTQQVTVDGSY